MPGDATTLHSWSRCSTLRCFSGLAWLLLSFGWLFTTPSLMASKEHAAVKEQLSQLAQDIEELRTLMQTLQVRLSTLSAQFISSLEILIQYCQCLHQLQDEYGALCNQLNEFLDRSHRTQISQSASARSDEASSSAGNFNIPDLNSPGKVSDMEEDEDKTHLPQSD
jgi:hypothetical protein